MAEDDNSSDGDEGMDEVGGVGQAPVQPAYAAPPPQQPAPQPYTPHQPGHPHQPCYPPHPMPPA